MQKSCLYTGGTHGRVRFNLVTTFLQLNSMFNNEIQNVFNVQQIGLVITVEGQVLLHPFVVKVVWTIQRKKLHLVIMFKQECRTVFFAANFLYSFFSLSRVYKIRSNTDFNFTFCQ